jgi:membrane fusion protein, multidrug efflux system
MHRERALALILGLSILAVAACLGASSTATEESNPATEERARRVRVGAVEADTQARTVRFAGVTRAKDRAALAFTVGARLAARPVEIGDPVRAGQVLARLDARELQNATDSAAAALAEIETRLAQVERDRSRVEQLAASRAATTEEVEQVTATAAALAAARDAAATRLKESRRLLHEAVLTAPFAGTVTAVHLEPGEMVTPGRPVVEVSGDGAVEVQVGVPESLLSRLQEGQKVTVELPFARGRILTGTLHSLGRATTGPGQLFPVLLALEDSTGVAAGMTAEVLFEVGGGEKGSETVTVPLEAVINPGGRQPTVFRLEDGHAHRIEVGIEALSGERVAVRGALQVGDEVVITGQGALLDGEAVEVLR